MRRIGGEVAEFALVGLQVKELDSAVLRVADQFPALVSQSELLVAKMRERDLALPA